MRSIVILEPTKLVDAWKSILSKGIVQIFKTKWETMKRQAQLDRLILLKSLWQCKNHIRSKHESNAKDTTNTSTFGDLYHLLETGLTRYTSCVAI